jgi:glycerol-3-phosphate acyltransferase PlsY
MMILIVALASAYILGSIPASYLIAKSMGGLDIRRHGSGNVGATNVLRTAGKLPGILALLSDVLKGVISVTLLSWFFHRFSIIQDYEGFRIIMGFMAITGHIWSAFMRFKGGKGVATTAGVILVLFPKAMAVVAIVFFLTVALTRYVSLGSLVASIILPITVAVYGYSIKAVIFCITLCMLSCYKHKSNIVRIINKEEPKIGQKARIT